MTDIRIEPWPPTRGRKSIIVDGAKWGSVHMDTHGVHGPTYSFIQDGIPGYLQEPSASGHFSHVIGVRATSRKYRPKDEPPIESLILDKVRELIAAGRLRDPAVVKAEQQTRIDADRQRAAEIAAAEQREFEAHAAEAIHRAASAVGGLLINVQAIEALQSEIIAAMRWAQTK
jgi:hypothetical protein